MEETKTTAPEAQNQVDPSTITAGKEPDYASQIKALQEELDRAKNAVSKANGEAAGYKRQLSERLTKEEADKLAQEEREKAIQEMLAERDQLLIEKRISTYTAQMAGVGITGETGAELAKILPDGVPKEFFDAIKKFLADKTAEIRADALKSQPTASVGMPLSGADVMSEEDKAMRKAFGLF